KRRPECEDVVETARVDLPRHGRMREECFDLGGEEQTAAADRIEQRPDAQPVARQEERAGPGVPNPECPLAVQVVDGGGAFLLEEMEKDFRIGLCVKAMTLLYEILTKFDVIEDFTIERDPQRPIVVRHRLMAAGDVDDAQSGVG